MRPFLCIAAVCIILALTPTVFAAQFLFTPTVTVTEEYNDNIFLDEDDEEDDYLTTVLAGLNFQALGRTSGLELNYEPQYTWYQDNSDEDFWQHDLLSRLWYDPSQRTHIELSNAFLSTQNPFGGDANVTQADDPLDNPAIAPDRNRRGNEEYWSNATSLNLTHQFGAQDQVYSGVSYSRLENDDPTLDDNRIWDANVGVDYWFTNFWGVQAEATFSHRDYQIDVGRKQWTGRVRLNRRITRHLDTFAQYQHTILDYNRIEDDYELYEPLVGFNYQLDANTRIQMGAGWYWQNFDRGGKDDGFIFESLTQKIWPFRRGQFDVTLVAGTDVDDRGVDDLGFRRYGDILANLQYGLARKLNGTAFAGYRIDDYPDQEPERTDDTITGGVGLTYQAFRWMSMALNYDYTDLSSDNEEAEYTENRVFFSITLTPATPYRATW